MADITAIILTGNEEKNIEECISSIKNIVQRIVVVDSGSRDRTVEIARAMGAEILVHEFSPFYQARQFIYALETITIDTKWILKFDADERLTEESSAELERLCAENADTDVNGIELRFEVSFMGKKLRHGGIYPFRKLVCFKNGAAYMEDREMDEQIVLKCGRAICAKCDSLHHDYKDLSAWIAKHNDYSSREATAFLKHDGNEAAPSGKAAKVRRFIKYKVYYKLPSGFRAWAYYMYRYIIRGGFLDGKAGKRFAFLQAYWYRFLVDAKIDENRMNKSN